MNDLIPPDIAQCQAEKPTGSFMSFGIPKHIRCKNIPAWVAKEVEVDKDGLRGSMSLCDECRAVLEKQKPDFATFIPLEPIGG